MLKLIDNLQENGKCYCIDFLPKQMSSTRFFEIEDFFIGTYLSEFSKKIVRIVVKLLGYYSTSICITEFPSDILDDIKIKYPIGKDISDRTIEEIAFIVSHVIIEDVSSVQILLKDTNSLISVNGGFSVNVYNPSIEQLQLITMLVEQENLFLRLSE